MIKKKMSLENILLYAYLKNIKIESNKMLRFLINRQKKTIRIIKYRSGIFKNIVWTRRANIRKRIESGKKYWNQRHL